MNGQLVDEALNREFTRIAERIIAEIPFDGAWFFQMKEDAEGTLKLLEIEPRIAGTMALNRVRGINFPLLHILTFAGFDVDVMINQHEVEIDRCLANRYRHSIAYSTVYVDFDDTLVVHDKLNTLLVRLLYQSVNRGCRIILISKSLNADKERLLKERRIAGLFDETIWLNEEESKADHIQPEKAIYIDDSFSQRREVHRRHGIPTFDCSMIELLIDERL